MCNINFGLAKKCYVFLWEEHGAGWSMEGNISLCLNLSSELRQEILMYKIYAINGVYSLGKFSKRNHIQHEFFKGLGFVRNFWTAVVHSSAIQ